MIKKIISLGIIISSVLLIACHDNDENTTDAPATTAHINEFVWKGLNSWYWYQPNVPKLADGYNTSEAYKSAISNITTENWFESLLSSEDDFSWIVDDYVALEKQFAGTYESYGFEYGLYLVASGSNNVMGFVRYVLPGTAAEKSGLKRGDFFLTINGTPLTKDNYQTLLATKNATLGLASITNGVVSLNGNTATAVLTEIDENPVYLAKTITTPNNTKVGYIMYNSFVRQYNEELNNAFAKLKSEGATELILDLRYNGGGSVETSAYLASMITGQFSNQIFGKLAFNAKHADYDDVYYMTDKMNIYNKTTDAATEVSVNKLGIKHLYVIATGSTASASEMIINGLKPYIEVTLIGTNTVGKNEGSITLYDVPNNDYLKSTKNTPNPNHKYAMQPIVFQIFNTLNTNDYDSGFTPDYVINELEYASSIKALGDIADPLLNKAIRLIDSSIPSTSGSRMATFRKTTLVNSSQLMRKHSMEMYIQ